MKRILILAAFTALISACNSPSTEPVDPNEIKIPSDSKAKYLIIDKGGSVDKPTLTTLRSGSSGQSYAKRLFDCKNKTTKYLAESETLEGLQTSKPDKTMSKIIDESIAWYQYKHVCPNAESTTNAVTTAQPLSTYELVAKSAMEKAVIAMQSKDYTNACVQLTIATAAFLEAKDIEKYKQVLRLKNSTCDQGDE